MGPGSTSRPQRVGDSAPTLPGPTQRTDKRTEVGQLQPFMPSWRPRFACAYGSFFSVPNALDLMGSDEAITYLPARPGFWKSLGFFIATRMEDSLFYVYWVIVYIIFTSYFILLVILTLAYPTTANELLIVVLDVVFFTALVAASVSVVAVYLRGIPEYALHLVRRPFYRGQASPSGQFMSGVRAIEVPMESVDLHLKAIARIISRRSAKFEDEMLRLEIAWGTDPAPESFEELILGIKVVLARESFGLDYNRAWEPFIHYARAYEAAASVDGFSERSLLLFLCFVWNDVYPDDREAARAKIRRALERRKLQIQWNGILISAFIALFLGLLTLFVH